MEKNYAEAFKIFKELSDGGDMDARYYLARMYYFPEGVTKNNAMAQWFLGILYLERKENDIKIEENKEYGIELLKKSAEQGYEEVIKKLKEISNI